MANLNNDLDTDEQDVLTKPKIDKKKLLLFLLPGLIVIGIAVGIYFSFNRNTGPIDKGLYSVVKKPTTGGASNVEEVIVFYDLPEVIANIKEGQSQGDKVKIKISLELSSVTDVDIVNGLSPKLVDAIIAHTTELTSDEVSGSSGLYWLKEELLYRINLITSPIKVNNVNFKNFEIINRTKEGK